jgi:FixJ family two-component response regulator
MADLTAFVVDDEESIRKIITDLLRDVEISARAYSTAEELRAHLLPSAVLDISEMPDLIVVDLQLQNGCMQGTDLIQELAERDIPSQIMAISGAVLPSEFANNIMCFGAAVLLPKPFAMSEFCPRAKRLAQIGYKKRMRRIGDRDDNRLQLRDPERKHRPVFLSYANEDEVLANGIRINIESYDIDVWYAPTALDVGHKWRREIEKGIDDACIFIAILSDHFLVSEMCLKEMKRFRIHLEGDSERRFLLLPVIADLSSVGRSHDLIRWIRDTYQYYELRPFISDCITALICRIQEHLSKKEYSDC